MYLPAAGVGVVQGELAGRTLAGGKYRLVAPIAAGAFGCTARAVQYLEGRALGLVAIKFPLGAAGEVPVDDFLNEAAAIRKVTHPNLVVLHDAFVEDGVPFLVMEHVEGRTLDVAWRIRSERTVELALHVAAQIASAGSAFHAKGVVHRDLKPNNIALLPWIGDEANFAKVLDFGGAAVWRRRAGWRGEGFGTPGFAPPEQWRGEATPRSDVFALGVILFWLLTGKLPYDPALAHDPDRFLRETPPPLPAGAPPELTELVRECLHPVEAKRYPAMPVYPLRMLLSGGSSPGHEAPKSQKEILTMAKDTFIRAGIERDEERRRVLYHRAAQLFDEAAEMGPLPAALAGLAEKARRFA